jgi:hypothetical protein
MDVIKKNTVKPDIKNLTVQPSKASSQPDATIKTPTIRTAIKPGPPSAQPGAKLEPKTESPALSVNVSEAGEKESGNHIIVIAVALLAAVWYLASIVAII